jgi:hypothetical protein
MSDLSKLKTECLKAIYSYYDIKDNVKYLLCFNTTSASNNDLSFCITNGVMVWQACLNEAFIQRLLNNDCVTLNIRNSSPLTLNEFLAQLNQIVKTEKYSLNKILQEEEDFIELKSDSPQNSFSFKILIEQSKSIQSDLKLLIFNLFDRFSKLETENANLNNKLDLAEKSSSNHQRTSNEVNHGSSTAAAAETLKKFNLSNSKHHSNNRMKPGMSIINPLSKRKKDPRGVRFDSDDDDDDNSQASDKSEHNSVNKSPCKKSNSFSQSLN